LNEVQTQIITVRAQIGVSMIQIIKVIFIGLLVIFGCSGKGDPISNNTTKPSFVIEELTVNGSVKLDTLTVSPATFISMMSVYHFEGQSGSLDGFSLSTAHQTLSGILEPYAPTPVDYHVSINSPELRDSSIFAGVDLIPVQVGFGGRFWDKENGSVEVYGTFSIVDTIFVHLQR
jgi:hypothetical protein